MGVGNQFSEGFMTDAERRKLRRALAISKGVRQEQTAHYGGTQAGRVRRVRTADNVILVFEQAQEPQNKGWCPE